MEDIDKIYCKHYQSNQNDEGAPNPLLCFSCHLCGHAMTGDGLLECEAALKNYLTEVKKYLQHPRGLEVLEANHPQRIGVENAFTRLEPFNLPIGVPGRLTLPLPSRSMLEDLWEYILSTDEDVLREVWLRSLHAHWCH
jgi:hypothetical protein